MTNQAQANQPVQQGQQRHLQLLTSYQHASGQYRLRVTTLSHTWADTSQLADIARGFDQEAAAVLMARIAAHKTQTEEAFDILPLHCRHIAVTLPSHCRYTAVTLP